MMSDDKKSHCDKVLQAVDETADGYGHSGNVKSEEATKRFTQELVIYRVKSGELRKLTESTYCQLHEKTDESVTLVHTSDTGREAFEKELEKIANGYGFLGYGFLLDGVSYESHTWARTYRDGNKLELEVAITADACEPSLCQGCNRIFMAKYHAVHHKKTWLTYGRFPSYCSSSCQRKSSSIRQSARRKSVRQSLDRTTTCKECGTSFSPKRIGAMFCSSACRVKHHRKNSQGGVP